MTKKNIRELLDRGAADAALRDAVDAVVRAHGIVERRAALDVLHGIVERERGAEEARVHAVALALADEAWPAVVAAHATPDGLREVLVAFVSILADALDGLENFAPTRADLERVASAARGNRPAGAVWGLAFITLRAGVALPTTRPTALDVVDFDARLVRAVAAWKKRAARTR